MSGSNATIELRKRLDVLRATYNLTTTSSTALVDSTNLTNKSEDTPIHQSHPTSFNQTNSDSNLSVKVGSRLQYCGYRPLRGSKSPVNAETVGTVGSSNGSENENSNVENLSPDCYSTGSMRLLKMHRERFKAKMRSNRHSSVPGQIQVGNQIQQQDLEPSIVERSLPSRLSNFELDLNNRPTTQKELYDHVLSSTAKQSKSNDSISPNQTLIEGSSRSSNNSSGNVSVSLEGDGILGSLASSSKHSFSSPSLDNSVIKKYSNNSTLASIPDQPVARKSSSPHSRSHSMSQCNSKSLSSFDSMSKSVERRVTGIRTASDDSKQSICLNGNEYLIFNLLGKGGSSEVFQIYDVVSKANRALKIVNLSGEEEEVRTAYLQELDLLLQFKDSDRIVHLFDYFHDESNPSESKLYLVLEKGELDLAEFLKKHRQSTGKQSEGDESENITTASHMHMVRYYWLEMLKAVQVIHQAGVVHSDLKPSNFLFVGPSIKLIDFGIADKIPKNRTSITKVHQMGTISYMSPEAAELAMPSFDDSDEDSLQDSNCSAVQKTRIGTKSDVWSLGIILYTMVYGRNPFQGMGNNMSRLCAIVSPKFMIKFADSGPGGAPLDPLLIDSMRQCLTRDPKLRPSVDQLLQHPYLHKGHNEEPTKPPDRQGDLKSQLYAFLASMSPNTRKSTLSHLNEKL